MYIHAEPQLIRHQFEFPRQISFQIPSQYSAIEKITQIEISLLSANHYPLLDILIIEFSFAVEITYIGSDHLNYTLRQTWSNLQTIEKPADPLSQLITTNTELQSAYQIISPTPTDTRMRQFELLTLVRLQHIMSYYCQKAENKPKDATEEINHPESVDESREEISPKPYPSPKKPSQPKQPLQTGHIRKWKFNGTSWYQ